MKRTFFALTLMLFASGAAANAATDEAFENLANEYIGDLATFSR